MPIVYLNGDFVPQQDAKVSIMDRGFLFGDGVYEVIPVDEGRMIGLEQHLSRLEYSLDRIHMTPPLTNEVWQDICHRLLALNDKTTGAHSLYIQITRGPQATRDPRLPDPYTPTCLAFVMPSNKRSTEELDQGFSAITLDDTRRYDCSIKAITLLPNVLLYELARHAGAVEAILMRNGAAVEGTSSNLFIVLDATLLTPPLEPCVLGGVTRELLIALAKQHDLPVEEKLITDSMLRNAQEVWLTGSSKEILPIVTLDGKPVGDGQVGPVWRQMVYHYEHYKRTPHYLSG